MTQTPSVTTPTPTTVNTTQKTAPQTTVSSTAVAQTSVSQDTVTNYNSVVGELAKKKPTLRETHPHLAKAVEKQDGNNVATKVKMKT